MKENPSLFFHPSSLRPHPFATRPLAAGGTDPDASSTVSAQVALREQHAVGLGIQLGEHLFNENSLDAARALRLDEVADCCLDPRTLADTKKDSRVFSDFQLVNRRVREQFAERPDALDHG